MADSKDVTQKDIKQKLSDKDPVENPTIRITGIKHGSDDLEMDDDGETVTYPENNITWIIETPDVEEITDIVPDDDPSKVFKAKPKKKVNDKKIWEGTTKNKSDFPDPYTIEKYTIKYKRTGDPNERVYDPIIQVNN